MNKPLHLERLRVYGKAGSLDIYKQLKGVVCNEYHGLFTLCVFLGYKHNRREENGRGKEQLFWSDTFSPHEYAVFNSLILKELKDEDYELLKDGEKMLELLQSYANGGMMVLLDSEVIKPHLKEKEGHKAIDFTGSDHLQKQIMYYVYSLYQQQDHVK